MIDLHTHTTASDGSFTPSQLIDLAIEKDLTALAITDHDTIDGYLVAESYLQSLKSKAHDATKPRLKLISGIEFSTTLPRYPFDIHILGLNMDTHSPEFITGLETIVNDRNQRNTKMLELLQLKGYAITQDDVTLYCKDSIVTRAHFAKILVQKGYFQNSNDAFRKLLGNDGPVYVPRQDVHAKTAIELITAANGIAAIAHPYLYGLDSNGIYGLIDESKGYGLVAIEAYYSLHSKQQTEALCNIAQRFSLQCVGGSDFHGDNKPGNYLGTGTGNLNVPDELLKRVGIL